MPDTSPPKTIALLGGGRWGRVLAERLYTLPCHNIKLHWLSSHGHEENRQWIADKGFEGIALHADEDQIWALPPDAVIIATANASHASYLRKSLQVGIPAFSEKPYALDAATAQALVDLTQEKNLCAGVDFEFMCADYVHSFKKQIENISLKNIRMEWHDPSHEMRHGELKHGDFTTPITQDFLPHCLSILTILLRSTQFVFQRLNYNSDTSASVFLTHEKTNIEINLNRRASTRIRKISLNGGKACLEFSLEPGFCVIDEKRTDYTWGAMRPLAASLHSFLQNIKNPDPTWALSLKNCLPFVSLCEHATNAYDAEVMSALRNTDLNLETMWARNTLIDFYAMRAGRIDYKWLTSKAEERNIVEKALIELRRLT